ncbi:DUF262 domain-containing protein [Curtobacterium sp. MCPF17_051]|uniref:DUF262 domain-containing protein n=1 Tax=Curtobacterium TaxID=2034 RepID=UPI0015E8AE12|nr:DUF262 domain-containing protein [Curtobacterium sp. MCPF17_051]
MAGTVEFDLNPIDDFDDAYEDPGTLTSEDVLGAVVYPLDWNVSTIVDQIDADPLDPDSTGILVTSPPFQRRVAWNAARQSLFIESLILGLPIPPLVLAESKSNPGQFYVLDGKQRLTAIKTFFSNTDPLRLQGLELLSEQLNGKTIDDLRGSKELRRHLGSLQSQPIRTVVVRNWRSPSLLHLIFSRLNKAAVPLASHELRQSIYPGPFTNYINEQSALRTGVKRARRLQEPDFRLRDAETLLRYIGIRTNRPEYGGDLKQFLDRVLQGGNSAFFEIQDTIDVLLDQLDASVKAAFDIFGERAFLRFDGNRGKYLPRFNAAVFDAITWHLTLPEVRRAAVAQKDRVVGAFEDLSRSDQQFSAFLTATTKTNEALNGRIDKWGAALSSALGIQWDEEAITAPIFALPPKGKR